MATTTKDEFPDKPLKKAKAETPLADTINEDVIKRYVKGENLYTIARAVYRFESEEAVESVRQILANAGYLDPTHKPPATMLMDED